MLVAAAVLVVAGLTAYGVIRVLEPDGLRGHRRERGRADRSGQRSDHRAVRGRQEPERGRRRRRIGLDRQRGRRDGHADRPRARPVRDDPGRRRPGRARVRRRLAVGRRQRLALRGAGRPGREQGRAAAIEVGNAPRALAATAGAVWVASGVDGRIQRIDLDRGRVTRPILVGANPSAIAAGAGALWVASEEAGTVTRIEPRTGSVVEPIQVGNGPSALAVGEGAVWVVNRHDGTLSRIDPATNAVSWTGGVGSDPTAVAVGEGSVWVAGGEEGTVRRVEPGRAARGREARGPEQPGGDRGRRRIGVGRRGRPAGRASRRHAARARAARAAALIPLDWLHWHAYITWATFQLSSLAYDGLVAYRRVEGPAGATLVGALATNAPAPSARRQDLRLHAAPRAALLRRHAGPTDGLQSLDGAVPAGHAGPSSGGSSRSSSRASSAPAVHAPAGALRPLAGDRDRLRAARTITIHLTRPDADFLHKLTMAFGFVVPAGSPAAPRRAGRRPAPGPTASPPGTRSAAGRSSATATSGRPGAPARRRLRGPHRGRRPRRADDRAADRRGPARRRRHRGRRRTRSSPLRPGESHPRAGWPARRAGAQPPAAGHGLDLPQRRGGARSTTSACGRRSTSRSTGTAWSSSREARRSAQPTCQVLPLGFPGYAPYCPYTARPRGRRGWTAPDMERARRLVAASGRAGDACHRPRCRNPARRSAATTRGCSTSSASGRRCGSSDVRDDDLYDPARAGADGLRRLGRRLPRAVDVHPDDFACAARGTSTSRGSATARWSARSTARSATPHDGRGRRWAAADRRSPTSRAAAPLTNRRSVVLVSKRVGNVKTHRAVVHPARPDVGALSLESFQNWNR